MANPVSAQVAVTTSPTLLWQTTTGISPDHAIDPAIQFFQAGTMNDPPTILIVNQGSANAYLGGSGVTTSNGVVLSANSSLTYNPVGNAILYATAANNSTVTMGVIFGTH